jgi:3-oxoacyl-[acyl-carrier-protein] synthase II
MEAIMKSVVTGIGWVTEKSIGRGRDHTSPPGGHGPIPLPGRKTAFHEPFPRFGRLDAASKIGITAIALALKDARRDLSEKKRNVGLIASSFSGCLATDRDYFNTVLQDGGRLASPNLFAYTLPNSFLGEAALHFGLTGTSYVVCEEPLTGLQGLRFAMESIAEGDSEGVLVGTCDTGCPEIDPTLSVPVPGALFCLLEREDRADRSSYGDLERDGAGRVRLNGKVIEDFFGLIQRCIEIASQQKGF